MTRLALATLLVLATGCGDDGAPAEIDAPAQPDDATVEIDAPSVDAAPAGFTLLSPTISEGGTIPGVHTCTAANTSPELTWVNPPANTASYALIMTDVDRGLIHWVIYDIPASATSLPADVDKVYAPADVTGAHQTENFSQMRGYVGPCPPQPEEHTYQLALYPLDVATLPGATMNTTSVQAIQTINQHRIDRATLMAKFRQP